MYSIMNYKIYLKYLLLMCLFIFCNDKNKHNETPKKNRKPNDNTPSSINKKNRKPNNNTPSYIDPINSSDADFKYKGCNPFPYECLDKHDNINYDDPRYETWRQGYLDYLKRNEDKIKQEIQKDVVKAFKKYYQNPKDNNGASIGSFERKNMFIRHFIRDKNGDLNVTLCESIKKQKQQLMDYFKQKNIVPIRELYLLNEGENMREKTYNIFGFETDLDDDENYEKFMKKYGEKIDWENDIYIMSICIFCGDPMYKSFKKSFNSLFYIERDSCKINQMKLICLNKQCIACKKIIDVNRNVILLTKGIYDISAKYNEHILFENYRKQIKKKLESIHIFDIYNFEIKNAPIEINNDQINIIIKKVSLF